MFLAGETNGPQLPPGKSWRILPARPGDWKLLSLEINIPRKNLFLPPLDNGSLHLRDKTEKKKKMMTKKGAREDSWSHAVFFWRPLHFLLQREHGKHTDPDNGFDQRGQSPHFLTHTYYRVYLKGVKAGTFTKALCQEVWLQMKPWICVRRKGSFTSS